MGDVVRISAAEAWTMLREDPAAMLVDVRTKAEWLFAGGPDLRELDKVAIAVSWQLFPAMTFNPAFVDQLAERAARETPLLFLSRAGNRSGAAAAAASRRGFARCYDVAEGFEGPPDDAGQRGKVSGWKASRLPWRQS